jgi:carbonic anhydrase
LAQQIDKGQMSELHNLFANNRRWAAQMRASDPGFFESLAAQQSPQYLWIGCADSRVPANEIVGLLPGEVFVHRNVANVVVHTDLNCLSVIQYAVDVLNIKHVIVCGHYGCGGVAGAIDRRRLGLIDNWLRHVQDVHKKHADAFARLATREQMVDRLCELNVIEQVVNVCQTTVIQDAWERGSEVTVHGWIYRLLDGELRDLCATVSSQAEVEGAIQRAVSRLAVG